VTPQLSPASEPVQRPTVPTIVVGVDGSEKNAPAVQWATREAAARRCRLVLARACVTFAGTAPGYDVWYPYEQILEETRSALYQLRERLCRDVPDVAVRVTAGGPLPALLAEAEAGADLLVVGQRGAGAWARVVVGSTSIAVAGRSPVPVVVVPDAWTGLESTGPVVIGLPVDPGEAPTESAAVVRFAFERAARLGVPLMAQVAVEVPHVMGSVQQIESWRQAHEEEASRFLATWHDRFPEVEVTTRANVAQPAYALLDAVGTAQMLVVGRHTGRRRIGGFSLGSTARAVLRYARLPIAVVPAHTVTESSEATTRSSR